MIRGINAYPNCASRDPNQQAYWDQCLDIAVRLGRTHVRSGIEMRDGLSICTTNEAPDGATTNFHPEGLQLWIQKCVALGLKMLFIVPPEAPTWWADTLTFGGDWSDNPFRAAGYSAEMPGTVATELIAYMQATIDAIRDECLRLGVDPTTEVELQMANEYAKGGAQSSTAYSPIDSVSDEGNGRALLGLTVNWNTDNYWAIAGDYVEIYGHSNALYNRVVPVTEVGDGYMIIGDITYTASGWGSASVRLARGVFDVAARGQLEATWPNLNTRGMRLWGPAVGPNTNGDDDSMDVLLETIGLGYLSGGIVTPTTWHSLYDGVTYHQYLGRYGSQHGPIGWAQAQLERSHHWMNKIHAVWDLPLLITEFGASLNQVGFDLADVEDSPMYGEAMLGEYMAAAVQALDLHRHENYEGAVLYCSMDYLAGGEVAAKDRFGMLRQTTGANRWNERFRAMSRVANGTDLSSPPTGTWQGPQGNGVSYSE